MVKNMLAIQETWVRSLDQEDPLEKEIAICSSILAWEIPWTEEPGGPQSMGSQKCQTQLSNQTTASSMHNHTVASVFLSFCFPFLVNKETEVQRD